MIDMHNHLLPGIDDGCATLDGALALACACVADGITHAVCTPHVFAGRFDNRRSSIEPAFERLRRALEAHRVPLTLSFAGEVRFAAEVLDLLDADELPFLGESNGLRNLLLELPDGQIPLGADALVRRLLEHGIRPVIAHPERNRAVMDKPQRIEPFVDAGCLLQITAASLVGGFGARAMAVAHRLIDGGLAAAVASDAHNLNARRPRMSEAKAVLLARHGPAVAFELLVAGPGRLCGVPVNETADAFGRALPLGEMSPALQVQGLPRGPHAGADADAGVGREARTGSGAGAGAGTETGSATSAPGATDVGCVWGLRL